MAVSIICSSCGKPMTAKVEGSTSTVRCESCGFECASSFQTMPPGEAAKFIRTASRHQAATMMVVQLPTAVIAAALVGILAWLLTRSAAVTLALAGAALFFLLALAFVSAARWQRRMFEDMLKMHATAQSEPPSERDGP